MKCPCCNGKGRVEYPMYADKEQTIQNAVLRFKTCAYCDGTGEVEQTNEEWFCQLPTTEKSEFLSAMVKEAIEVHEKYGITWHEAVSWWDGWLKEKHHAN